MKREICNYTTWRYWALSLNLSVPLVLFPSICLSIPHASVFCAASIIHPEQMNISRGCWTLFLHTSCSHCCLCFYQSARCPSSCSATSPFHGSSLGAFVQYISMCYSWSQFCGVCKGVDFGLVLWPAFCPCSPFITSASCESACEWWLPADTCTPSSSVPGVFGGKINGRGVWSDGLLGL